MAQLSLKEEEPVPQTLLIQMGPDEAIAGPSGSSTLQQVSPKKLIPYVKLMHYHS